jgi:uncharacterized iron-regulated membrane protein
MKKPLVILFIIAGILFLALAIYYWVTPAGSLPHGFPGYIANASEKHLKHGLAALVLALGAWVLAWFLSGKKDESVSTSEQQE